MEMKQDAQSEDQDGSTLQHGSPQTLPDLKSTEILPSKQGETEVEMSSAERCKQSWLNCRKKSGHDSFIPVDQFSISHLPPEYRDNDIYDLIKHLAHLVVKISISCTSTSRPKYVNRIKYPCHNDIGTSNVRLGSGRVWDVDKHTEKEEDRSCECRQCKSSETPKKSWGEINIVTARHVVFDNLEGQFAQCWLNYNNETSKFVILEGTGIGTADLDKDLCYVRCATHDLSLVNKLKRKLDLYTEQCEKIYQKLRDKDLKLIALVSHPHGWFKRVSVGEQRAVERTNSGDSIYVYTAGTCPGSSGAPVYILSKEKVRWCSHHHSGSDGIVNYSAIGWL